MDKPHTVISEPHMHFDRKNALIGAIVLVVMVITGLWWYAAHHSRPEPASKVKQYNTQALINEVNKKYGAHDYLGAIRLIEGQKTLAEIDTQRLLAAAYANSGDNKKALAVYSALDTQGKLNEVDTATAADIADRAKEYQRAIDLYKKAKEKLQGSATNSVDQAAIYDYKIAEIQKKL